MGTKPLAYDSLKIVIQHMEANKRIQLASRIASIRLTEKAVPLKINTIRLGDSEFEVNQVKYRVGLYQEYSDGNESESIYYQNMYGYFQDDIDEFGFVKRFGRRTVLPGDLLIGQPGLDEEDDRDDKERMRQLENELKEEEGCLEKFQSAILQLADSEPDKKNKNKINGEHLDLLNDGLDPLQYVADNRNHPRARLTLKTAMDVCSGGIELLKESLSPFYHRQDNIPLPYTPLIQISISGKGINQVHRLPYNMKVFEAQKRLAFFIFGNRSCPIKTGSLQQEFCEIFRLPVGVKFHIQKLQINGNITKIHESIKPIIEETSFPLAVLQTCCYHNGHQNYAHEIVKSARELVIGEFKRDVREVNWFDLFTSLNNKIVHKMLDDKFFSKDDYVRLIENWSENCKEIGTCFSFGINKKSRIRQILDGIKRDVVGVVAVDDKCVRVPMKSDSQRMIQISYGTNDYELASLKLKIEVIPTNLT